MIGLLSIAGLLGAVDVSPTAANLPADTLLLLVAPWCAPCWQELKRLDEIAAAAAPLRVRVVMMDDGPRARAMMTEVAPQRQWEPRVSDRAGVRAALWSRTPALPYGVATDGNGKICGERGGGMNADQARILARSCAARAH